MISVLFVDNEPHFCELVKSTLEQSGLFSVDTAESASAALGKMKHGSYDAIVSDYQMPDMNGIEFLKALRASGNEIPFIIFTGKGREEVVIQAYENGADFYVQKSGDPEVQYADLAQKITRAVGLHRAEHDRLESEDRLRQIIQFLPDATFAIDMEGRVIAWNKAIEEMTGAPASQMIGKGKYEYAIPFYGERRPILIDLAMQPDEETTSRYAFVRKEGRFLEAEASNARLQGKDVVLWGKATPLYDTRCRLTGAIESIRDITGFKKTEETLRESEARYRRFAENAKDLIYRYTFTPIRGFTYVSPSSTNIVGYTPEEHYADPDIGWKLVFEDDRHLLESLAHDPGVYKKPLVVRWKKKDGTVIWTEQINHPIYDNEGNIIAVEGIARDITDRTRSEEAIREKQIQLANAMDLSHLVMWEYDVASDMFTFNDNFYSLYGTTASQEGGYQMSSKEYAARFVHPDDVHFVAEEVQNALKSTDPSFSSQLEHRIVRRDGEVRFIIVRIAGVAGESGTLIKTYGANQDITDRIKAETTLRESEARYRTFVENAAEGVVVIQDGKIVYANPAALLLTRESLENLLEKPFGQYIHPDDRDMVVGRYKRRMLGEDLPSIYDFRLAGTDGYETWVQISVAVIPWNGRPATLNFLSDITERKQREQLLQIQHRIATLCSSPAPLSEILPECMHHVLALTRMDAGGIFLVDEHSGLSLVYSTGLSEAFVREEQYHMQDSPQTEFVMQGRPYFGDFSSLQFPPSPARASEGIRALAVVPFVHQGRVTGCMNLASHTRETFPQVIQEAISTLAIQMGSDISRIQASEALRKSEEKFRRMVETAAEGIWEMDQDFHITYANQRMADLLGYTREEMVGREISTFMDRDELPDSLGRKERQRQGIADHFERKLIRKDGMPLWIYSSVTPVFDADGRFRGSFAMYSDITDRKLIEAEIRSLNQVLEQRVGERTAELTRLLHEREVLIREVHHRVKNNLQIIISLLNLQGKYITDQKVLAAIRESQNRIKSMALVHERMYQSEEVSRITFREYVRFLVSHLFTFYDVRAYQVSYTITMDPFPIDIDTAIPLGLIMTELVSNSLKHAFPAGRKGTISIEGRKVDGHTFRFVVKDNGVGISPEIDWKNSDTLGLRLVKSLVTQLNGTIELDRADGTTFTLHVRAKEAK